MVHRARTWDARAENDALFKHARTKRTRAIFKMALDEYLLPYTWYNPFKEPRDKEKRYVKDLEFVRNRFFFPFGNL